MHCSCSPTGSGTHIKIHSRMWCIVFLDSGSPPTQSQHATPVVITSLLPVLLQSRANNEGTMSYPHS